MPNVPSAHSLGTWTFSRRLASHENWAQWGDHVAATFRAFIGDDLAAKKARESLETHVKSNMLNFQF